MKRARERIKEDDAPLPWDEPGLTRAMRVIRFLEWLPINAGPLAGQNMRLQPFQKRFIAAVYGPKTEDYRRQVREALLSIARKNGKTGLAAGLCLCHLSGPESEARGQCYSAASDREQASIIFGEMEAMIEDRPGWPPGSMCSVSTSAWRMRKTAAPIVRYRVTPERRMGCLQAFLSMTKLHRHRTATFTTI
nr:terminase large subunit [Iodidimonas nitroreducens]